MRMFRRPSHGTVAAYLALFIALGGTAYALERGSITSREIAKNTIKSGDIRSGGVGKPEVRANAVGPSEIRENAVRESDIREDSVGAEELAPGAVTGENVIDGSLALVDMAPGIADVEFDPPVLNAGECASTNEIDVPNKNADDRVIVVPGSEEAGWHEDLTLDAYSARGVESNEIAVTLCRSFGTDTADPGPQPLTVLLLG